MSEGKVHVTVCSWSVKRTELSRICTQTCSSTTCCQSAPWNAAPEQVPQPLWRPGSPQLTLTSRYYETNSLSKTSEAPPLPLLTSAHPAQGWTRGGGRLPAAAGSLGISGLLLTSDARPGRMDGEREASISRENDALTPWFMPWYPLWGRCPGTNFLLWAQWLVLRDKSLLGTLFPARGTNMPPGLSLVFIPQLLPLMTHPPHSLLLLPLS